MITAPEDCGCAFQDMGTSVANSPICNGLLLFMALVEGFIGGRCAIAEPCSRITGVDTIDEIYDFIVVGSGAAGSVVASRLSENDNHKVLLIEAGGPDPVSSRVPGFYRNFWSNAETDWLYRTQPDNYCLVQEGRGCVWPRGKVLGGSTVLNGMMYHRGHKADYDNWVEFGAEGWSWEDNLPYFLRSEDNKQIGSLVSSDNHATGGPMPIQQFNHQGEFTFDLRNAIQEVGLPLIDDFNDPNTPEGFAIAQTFSNDGQRYTTARAFLQPAVQRGTNLHVLLNSRVTKVLINGTEAYGVEYIRDGVTNTVLASKEVILSAGALNSPHILMLSGIGPKETLDQFDIPVVADLPVGQNLRNHIGMTLSFLLEKVQNTETLDWTVATEYLLDLGGPMSSTGITQQSGVLYSSFANKSQGQPDLQFFFNGFYAECSKTGVVGETVGPCPDNGRNISASAVALLPRSIGNLTLNSSNPMDPPLFFPNYFSDPADMAMVKEAALFVKKILLDSESLQEKYGVKLDPSFSDVCNGSGAEWSDEWLECMARTYTDAQNHQLGTTAISKVVDTQLRVFNVTGLCIVDAGVMPTMPTGNPQAAIMMVGERGAEFIKNRWS